MATSLSTSEGQNEGTTNAAQSSWRLRRYGRFLPSSKESDRSCSWKVFEPSDTTGQLTLTIVPSGHLLVSQGRELLVGDDVVCLNYKDVTVRKDCLSTYEGFSLIGAPRFLKVQRKSDMLLFRVMTKGESRMFRLQFEGCSREEALGECDSAALRLQEYLPICTSTNANSSTNANICTSSNANASTSTSANAMPPPAKPALKHKTSEEGTSAVLKVAEGSLPIRDLAQSFMGQSGFSLPLAYHQSALPNEDLGPLLRLCLLDQSFPALVEAVEGELKRLTQE